MARTTHKSAISGILVFALLACALVFATVAAAKPAPKPAALSGPTSSVNITVRSVTGRLVSDAKIELFRDRLSYSAVSDANGLVSFQGVPYGTYRIAMRHRLFCDTHYTLVVDAAGEDYVAIVDPISLWEGIGY